MRAGIALLAAFALTAFAPAPFPRTKRAQDGFSLERFQGKWRVVMFEEVGAKGEVFKSAWNITAFRVEGAQMTFLTGDVDKAQYALVIDGARNPATIDFYFGTRRKNGAVPSILGLIRREGDVVKILILPTVYYRAGSFEHPPEWSLLVTSKRAN